MINLVSFIIGVIVAIFVFKCNRKYFIGPYNLQRTPECKGEKNKKNMDIPELKNNLLIKY